MSIRSQGFTLEGYLQLAGFLNRIGKVFFASPTFSLVTMGNSVMVLFAVQE